MDQYFSEFPDYNNYFKTNNQTLLPKQEQFSNYQNDPNSYQNLNITNDFQFNSVTSEDINVIENSLSLDDLDPTSFPSPGILAPEGGSLVAASSSNLDNGGTRLSPSGDSSSDESDFSETVLNYISQILMEENIEEKPSMFFDPLGLKVTEKSFYDVLGENYPSPDQPPLYIESPEDVCSGSTDTFSSFTDTQWIVNSDEYNLSSSRTPSNLQFSSQFPIHNQNSQISNGNEIVSELLAQNIFAKSESVLLFQKGLEEASKFIPGHDQLVIDLEKSTSKLESSKIVDTIEKVRRDNSPNGSTRRKDRERDDIDSDSEEKRSNKQSAISVDESNLCEMFDSVLLLPQCRRDDDDAQHLQGSNSGKTRAKKYGKIKETVDSRSLLILCAQAVSTDDRRTAHELLKQIRQYSSPFGDGSQRSGHYFANALEARLAGTGSGTKPFFASPAWKKASAVDMLKAYQVLFAACPYKKMSFFVANKMILNAAEKANGKSLHIVDFGILYGFQWPILIQNLSLLPDGPPKLRITGIEFPLPGFRPAERIEETGQRLAKYCEHFGVPFEYHAIASHNWETIRIEDLKLHSNEVLAVNCMSRFKNLPDETVEENSPRDSILNLIRKMNPDIFVHSIVNGSYNAPFFLTRFREALFHFSALYDMFDANISRDCEERMMLEKDVFGREVMNVVACEGLGRVERPETYKQWQVRCRRAGFEQIPLDQELMNKFRDKLKRMYHKDFMLDDDNHWMLHGWRGRIVYASACFVPV